MSYQNNRHITSPPDKTLLVVVSFLVIIGFLAIFSATAPKCLYEGVNPAQFLLKQIINFGIGFAGLKFFTNYDYKKLATDMKDKSIVMNSAFSSSGS